MHSFSSGRKVDMATLPRRPVRDFMTTTALAAALVVFSLTNSLAQNPSSAPHKLTFGVKGGLALSQLVRIGPAFQGAYLKSKLGATAGGFINLRFSHAVSIQTEILFVRKGYQWRGYGYNLGEHGTIKIDYIEVPVFAKITFCENRTIRPFYFTGPYLDIRTRALSDWVYWGELYLEKSVNDVTDRLRTTHCGWLFGTGIAIHALSREFTIEVRYDLGSTRVFINGVVPYSLGSIRRSPSQERLSTLMIMLSVSY
jgi:hypothetical protein